MNCCVCILVSLFTLLSVACAIQQESTTVLEKCWNDEDYDVIEKCHPCNSHETSIHSECQETGYIETVKCSKSGMAVKRCPIDKHLEMVTFWKFETTMIVMSLVMATAVMLRMRKLDHENQERIQRQISAL